MDLIHNLSIGFGVALSLEGFLFAFVGALLGTLIGVLPGIGPTATVAMLLPITYYLSPTSSLIMLAGIYYGSQYGGSTTAILVNLPGEVSSSVTVIDGYQMARKGKAGTALAISAIGSFIAGTIATLLIAAFALPLAAIALKFGATEYFSLIVLGLVASTALAHGSIVKALAMIVMGMLFGLIGTDVATGVFRFTYGVVDLRDGLPIVAVALGLFGVVEVLRNLETLDDKVPETMQITRLWPSREDMKEAIAPILRGTAMGSILGILPGGGSILSAFASYAAEKRLSKKPEEFGHGAIAGVAGPESANNAGAQTSFIPLLTLGIPSHPLMALMMSAMIITGVTPGPRVIIEKPELFWGVIASMWVGNLMLVILNLPLVGIWVKLLRIPYVTLFPIIVAFSAIGVYTVDNNIFHLYVLAAFGIFGYLLYKLECEPAPFLLGFVLGDMLEEYFVRAMKFAHGDVTVFVREPISGVLLAAALGVLLLMMRPAVSRKREEIFVED